MTKKQLILDAAIELFAEKGIESTSVQQITDKCGISKGSFYLIFKSKEELIIAIIDYFMQSFLVKVDHAVNTTESGDDKLYQYFYSSLNFFNEYKSLALIFLREQVASISELSFHKLMHYEMLGMQFLSRLLDEIYSEKVKQTKYDLIVIMQSMLNAYLSKLLFTKSTLPFEQLASMLVEKTNILAHHSKQSILTADTLFNTIPEPITCETLLLELQALKSEVTSSIHLQSIDVLIEELNKNEPNKAILFGVVNNLSDTYRGHWIAHLIHSLYKKD